MTTQDLIQAKEGCLRTLVAQYKALYEQLSCEQSESKKVNIKEEIETKERDIAQLQSEIESTKRIGEDKTYSFKNYHLNWQDNFPRINFTKSKKIIDRVLKGFECDRGAAFFLLQKKSSMRGDLCIKHLKSQMQNIGTWKDPIEIEFLCHQKADPNLFLNQLSSKFQVDSHLTYATQGICNSLVSGNVLLIHLSMYSAHGHDSFFDWFVNQFWGRLVFQLEGIDIEKPHIRVVTVLSIEDNVPKQSNLSALYCTSTKFDCRKIVELPLQNWTPKEVKAWLFNFSNLMSLGGMTRNEIESIAENVCRVNDGNPDKVYNDLMDLMTKKVS